MGHDATPQTDRAGGDLPDGGPTTLDDKRSLSAEQVRGVAKLSRLAIDEDRVQQLRGELSAVLAYMDRLREVDVTGVEPMTHPTEMSNRLEEDRPPPGGGTAISTDAFMAMAPECLPPFVKVPPVIGAGSA